MENEKNAFRLAHVGIDRKTYKKAKAIAALNDEGVNAYIGRIIASSVERDWPLAQKKV